MRILTVRPPWAQAIFHGKDVENRTWSTEYRGRVAVHSGLRFDNDAWDTPVLADWMADYWGVTRDTFTGEAFRGGAIIGVVDLVDVHDSVKCYGDSIQHAAHLYRTDREAFDALPLQNGAGGLVARGRFCSEWAQDDVHHMVLANPRPLSEPMPFKGALGLRRLDADTITRIEGAL